MMSDYPVVELNEDDILCCTSIDHQRGVLLLTQISVVAPHTIEKFKDAGWTVEKGILKDRNGTPVPRKPITDTF